MNGAKKKHLKSMPVTALKIPLFLCTILILLAGSGSSPLAAQSGGTFQPTVATPIHDARLINKTNGSAVNLSLLRPEVHRTQGLAVETTPDPLTCNGSPVAFESGIPSDWTVIGNTGSVYWSTTDDLTACDNGGNLTLGSGEAACADSDTTNIGGPPFDTELWSNSFEIPSFTTASLNFAAAYDDFGTADKFEVWIWDGSSWNMELQWDEDHLPENVSLDISAYAGLPDVGASFRYHGDGWDWYAQVDDVLLTCVTSPPDIYVDPLFIGSTQESGSVTNHLLEISNVGNTNLDWFIEEDSALAVDVCGTPADIPWVSVIPGSGTTAPSNTDVLDVTFDATGLTPGTYVGVLCILSNDPDPGPGNNTELVIVDLELVAEAAPDIDIYLPLIQK